MRADRVTREDAAAHLAHLRLPGDLEGVRDGLVRLMAHPLWADVPIEARPAAELVLAEALNNVAEHAYALRPGEIELSLERVVGAVAVRIADRGASMPLGILPAGIAPDPAALPEGGFGWHLIRSLTTDLCYRRHEGWNLLTFRLPDPETVGPDAGPLSADAGQ